ncbi:MutS-related protein [Staphylococcus simiae]|uniref:MutS family DNA mismatch repair protein n=1 Tax=Staphylococcus simiae CCM 7213 = CCUG 51256 TaxID=911238 RepID=G5JKS6_9STAP|nr:AAA family ATPase [Staphylococcus simiae]EHJ07205.1 hypothetical protein SS7213T_10439 [Staphylococcus simiae CCM 7213 = CCUG 51256]PNZ14630.1 MutS family DNA mismatch repair protein [Staphylococcus simiae]SNV76565.1 MutS-related protein, family 1 [Staphylococcus simiae]
MNHNHTFMLFLIAIILLTIIVGVIGRLISRKRLFNDMENLWHTMSPIETFIRPNAKYNSEYQLKKNDYDSHQLIDDKTWSDLNMSDIFHMINYNFTAIGEMRLYATLRGMYKLNNQTLLSLFKNNKAFRQQVAYRLALIGKTVYPKFPDQITFISSNFLLMLCPLLPVITALVIFINAQLGLLLFLASCIVNIVLSSTLKRTYDDDLKSMFYISKVLQQGYAITKIQDTPNPEVNFSHFKAARRLTGILADINDQDVGGALIKLLKMIFMLDYLIFHSIQRSYNKYKAELNHCFSYVAQLDNYYALAMYQRTLDVYCEPQRNTQMTDVQFTELTHPLIVDAVANSFTLNNNVLLTGSNASGKSTFMKAVAINLILAQTINTATARSFTYEPGNVYTSMANADDVLSGDSYFMAELKSIKRIVNINSSSKLYCFIDEIFKGTNTTERIAASESVLSYLDQQSNVRVIAATHDIELADMLKQRFINYHFNEIIENNNIHFDYTIKPGKANTRNAIELLKITDFPETIYQRAKDNVSEDDHAN